MTQNISSRSWIELGLLGLIWGGVFLATRIALDEISVLHAVTHRLIWAAVILWVYVLWKGYRIPRSPRIWVALLVMGALNNIIPFTLLNWAQLSIESGLTSIFNASTALFGVVVAAIFLKDERLSLRKSIGVGVGFLGVVMAIGPAAITQFDLRSVAQLAAIAATLSYAFAGVWARKFLSDLTPQVAAMGMVTASALTMLPLSWVIDGPLPMMMSVTTWGAVLYYALVATALAYLLYYRILKAAGSGNLMLVTLIIPPIAIFLGAWLRDETIPTLAYFGLGLLALGLLILDGRVFKRRSI